MSYIQNRNKLSPTISVCVPVYNIDVRKLAYDLIKQLDESIELIFIDDCSFSEYKKINEELKSKCLTWIDLPQNVGRAKIRNIFLKYAKNEYLLFIDCDSEIININYLKNYQNYIHQKNITNIVFGGRAYPKKAPAKDKILAWYIGSIIESKSASQRSICPNNSFMTNNFIIKKDLFSKHLFDERIINYGHEDTLYGIELYIHNITIEHIDNPILNAQLDSNEQLIVKTELSIDTLINILSFYERKELLYKFVNLLSFIKKIETLHLQFIFTLTYRLFGKYFRKRLINSKRPSLKILNLYKLLYFFGKVMNAHNKKTNTP